VRRRIFLLEEPPAALTDSYYPADMAGGAAIEQPAVTRHAEWARMGRSASGGAGMTGGACGVVVAGVRVGTTEWERPVRLKFAA
jgi:hypothetical protein